MIDHLLSRRKSITRQAKSRFHDKGVSLPPLRRLGRFPRAQFEIAGVKQSVVLLRDENLGRTKNMTGGQESDIDIVHDTGFAKREHVFDSRAGEAGSHQTRRAFGENDLVVQGNMIAVRVGHEGKALRFSRVEP